jgi:hypothetical protein
MSDLTAIEKRKFERLLQMESGYVLTFNNTEFDNFFVDTIGESLYDMKHDNVGSGSKANRLRAFWTTESNSKVARILAALIERATEQAMYAGQNDKIPLVDECRAIVRRLGGASEIPAAAALSSPIDDRDFEAVAKEVQASIAAEKPAAGLDRLHTFMTKYLRHLCEKRGISVDREKPLHSLMGHYVKHLRAGGHIESEMADRILRGSISTLDAFNAVRNEHSLAHDNSMLGHEESLLIFRHVAATVRFLQAIEATVVPF